MGHKTSKPRLTPKIRAAEVEREPVRILGIVLGHDPAFQQRVAVVRDDEDPAQRARREAAAYIKKGPGREAIARLLLEAASVDDPRRVVRKLVNAGSRVAVWTEAPPSEGEAVRGLRSDRRRTFTAGAELLARRGANQCLECGTGVSRAVRRSVVGRRVRSDYCSACERKVWLHGPHKEAIRMIADAAAEALLDGPKRFRRRRTRRRSKTAG